MMRVCASWMRAVSFEATMSWCVVLSLMSPPVLPEIAMVLMPFSWAILTESEKFLPLPDVVNITRTSPGLPCA